MNKKKALFTSLAALALASTQAQTFAEEVDATIAEPTVAEVPAVDEVAQDAPAAEEPVAEAVAEEALVEADLLMTTYAATDEEVVNQPAENVADIDVAAILSGDYSSAYGVWENAEGDQIQFEDLDITYVESQTEGEVLVSWGPHVTFSLVPAGKERVYFGQQTDASQPRFIDVLARGYQPTVEKYVYYRKAVEEPVETIPEEFVSNDGAIVTDETGKPAVTDQSTTTRPETAQPSVEVVETADEVVDQPAQEQAPAVTDKAGDATPEPAQPSVEVVETANEVVAQPAQEQAPAVTAIAGDATPEPAQPSIEVVEESATSPVNKPVQTPFSPIAGQWVNGYGNIIEISETGEMYFGGIRISPESFTTQLEVYAGFDNAYLTGVSGVQGISYLADTDQLRLSLPIGWAPLADEEAEKAAREDFTKLTLYSRVTAVNTSSVAEELVAQPVVAETVAPTTSEVVQVPLTAKTEAVVAPVASQPAQPTYQRTAKVQSDKGILPETGEAVSILGILGAGLSALGLVGLKRRK